MRLTRSKTFSRKLGGRRSGLTSSSPFFNNLASQWRNHGFGILSQWLTGI